ncbi:MAG: hypothetical protein D6773_18485 [Alphaproteobacteria bacterium]|nr:MAG: hypothetical protein D6773_18485 [Alphaproteobacteria bacterium]
MRVGAIGKNAGGGAESAHAAASEAPDAGGEENSPEPAPVVSAAERKWQAMDDAERKRAWIKMADDLAVARARIRDLEGRLKVFEADGDIGKTLGMALRNLAVVEGRAKEHQANAARLQRRVNAQAKEIAALKKQLAAQEFEL